LQKPVKPKVSRKAKLFTESVIRQMTRLAHEHGAVNLAQGMPDFEAPARIKVAAAKAIRDGLNQYELTWGSVALREAISDKAKRFNGIDSDPETDITVTCGSTEAMTDAIIAVADPGEEVIIPQPFYENYVPATIIAGARPRFVTLRGPGFGFDEEELKTAFSSRTKAIIINTPNNPSGKVFTKEELKAVGDLCADYDVLAITDEIYEHILYDGRRHVSIASLAGMHDRTVTISGLSKTYSVTGWRVGYAIASPEISQAIRKVHDFSTVCAPAPFQKAGVEALALPQSYYNTLAKNYQKKRDYIVRELKAVGFDPVNPEGAYYVMADFGGLSRLDDAEFARWLVKEAKVATVPGSSFYANPRLGRKKVRFNFSKRDETIESAMRLLRSQFTD
jgi:aspartate/methionine/tyrosine aminotransferase